MGCASSSPLVESGKNLVEGAKESVSDGISKAEKSLQDAGETAKESLQSGIESVKTTVQTAVTATENGVETVMGKIGDTFHFTSTSVKEATDDLETKKDELITNASDAAAEVVSESETILASETESAKEAFSNRSAPVFETVRSFHEDVVDKVEGAKENLINVVDDVESDVEQHFGVLGDDVSNVEQKVKEELNGSPHDSPAKEAKTEEATPTFWEAAADAILLRKTIKSMDFREPQAQEISEVNPDSVNKCEVTINQFLTKDNDIAL